MTIRRRKAEEVANAVSHGIGVGLAIVGTAVLVVNAARYGTIWHIVTYSVFGASMLLTYLASTLFHSAKKMRTRRRLNKFDHSAIYIMIASTYTPLSLATPLRGWIGWTIFGLIWALALTGVIYRVFFYDLKYRTLSTWLYVMMGWLLLFPIVPLICKAPLPVPAKTLWFLLAGCLSYTVSIIFFLHKKPFFHVVFHLFILGGTICHFFAFLKILR
ncbi:MAG: hemolysin III family protein [Bacteroidales bacterium]|jgi:hemolysin III|nr:hemolysin III family protein [Bacteroidales bacterium]